MSVKSESKQESKNEFEGFVKECEVEEDGKKFSLYHNPKTGEWKKKAGSN